MIYLPKYQTKKDKNVFIRIHNKYVDATIILPINNVTYFLKYRYLDY